MNGLYTVVFRVGAENRSMIMVINNGTLKGGNTEYYYNGTCTLDGEDITGSIVAKHYAGRTDQAFGNAKEIPLEVKGRISGNTITGEARQVQLSMVMPFSGEKRG
nr:GrlR family regulatory protein [uncultured Pseudodesulfovibrio sp.]